MKLFQVLIALFILTVSASVYAMSVHIQPVSMKALRQPAVVKLNPIHSSSQIKKSSIAEKKIQAFVLQQRFSRLLSTSA